MTWEVGGGGGGKMRSEKERWRELYKKIQPGLCEEDRWTGKGFLKRGGDAAESHKDQNTHSSHSY